MTHKRFSILVVVYTIIFLFLAGLLVYLVDPFVHFHSPFGSLKVAETNEYYQNVGVARNLQYDNVIAGSSMAENFQSSWFDEGFGGKSVKLTFQGWQLVNYKILFDEIFSHQKIKRIFFPLDNFILTDAASSTAIEIPSYLYGTVENDGLWESMPYLLNKDVLVKQIPKFLINNIRHENPEDVAYSWNHKFIFSKEVTLNSYFRIPEEAVQEMVPDDFFYPTAEGFLNTIIPFIEENPETEFYIWMPPYSILYWDDSNRQGYTNAEISAQGYVAWNLMQYENVKVFYFQNLYDIITDLDNYKDYSHYSKEVNYYIYECFLKGENQLTPKNYHTQMLKTKEIAETYDFVQLLY